ncbi:MAG: trypsin-like peptidase domain-containing protein, partial [Oligoflexales bacterium]|nr:trypsin-like peptidase domain-containing protein [Oligoflexales bacterium]
MIRMCVFFLSVLLGFIIGGCHPKSTNSSLSVVGGVENWSSYPSAIAIFFFDSQKNPTLECTGVFISDSHVLTAAHCIRGSLSKPAAYATIYDSADGPLTAKKLVSSTFAVFPGYVMGDTSGASLGSDIAIITFPKNSVAAGYVARLSSMSPVTKDRVYMVGYGRTKISSVNNNPDFKRYTGSNEVATIIKNSSDAVLTVSLVPGPETAGVAKGDSGGPLFNSKGEIVGITKGNGSISGYYVDDPIINTYPKSSLFSFFINVNNPKVRAFIQSVVPQTGSSQKTPSQSGVQTSQPSETNSVQLPTNSGSKPLQTDFS